MSEIVFLPNRMNYIELHIEKQIPFKLFGVGFNYEIFPGELRINTEEPDLFVSAVMKKKEYFDVELDKIIDKHLMFQSLKPNHEKTNRV